MKPILEAAKKAAERIRSENGIIHLVSHFDADGISSAAIMTSALKQLNKSFYVTIVRHITPKIIDIIKEKNCPLVIFTDIGSSYIEHIEKIKKDIIILDHHEIKKVWTKQNMIHVNPELFKMDNVPGAYVANIVAKELLNTDDLTPLALIGSIGDSTYPDLSIFDDHDNITREKGLNLFGRFTRPIHKALELCFDPEIPGVTGSESAALQFLSEINLETKYNGEWRTIGDLTKEELQKLTDAIIKEHLKNGNKTDLSNIFGNIWTLKQFKDELRDGTEFATILNCCGRLDEPAVGIALCLGSNQALEKSRKLIKKYRRMIGKYMQWINNTENVRNTDYAKYVIAGDSVHENFIGTIVSIYFRSSNSIVPVIGMANSELGVKISGRSDGKVNINKIVSKAAAAVGGDGGGHKQAAGATIPRGKEEEFVEKCNYLLKTI